MENSSQYQGEYKKGDVGYIDGWLRAADKRPYAAIIFPLTGKSFLAMSHEFKALGFKDPNDYFKFQSDLNTIQAALKGGEV